MVTECRISFTSLERITGPDILAKEGMIEVRKIEDVRGGYLEHNCFHSTIEISEELEMLLAKPELEKYLSEPKEVFEVYERTKKESRTF
ncbi:MAG: hypothetical protein M1587_07315 [Thaumarchaeota archaeon]|nr:hypothetical protein [Nitrososphaerota archaeon]